MATNDSTTAPSIVDRTTANREAFTAAEQTLSRAAWVVRQAARIIGKTKVGAALLTSNGHLFAGCNVEHKYRAHCVHAEVNAITTMVANSYGRPDTLACILIAAERESFTPCGSCMDWIFELGGPATIVGFQGEPNGPIKSYTAHELMPHYPS